MSLPEIATYRIVAKSAANGETEILCRGLLDDEADKLYWTLCAKYPDSNISIEREHADAPRAAAIP